MSTRGCIAERKGDHWEGVYQHSDSYPTWLGKTIWKTIHEKYKGDAQKFINFAIHKHDGGWSSFPEICYCHGKFAKRDGTKPGQKEGVIRGCECNNKPYKSSNKDKDNPRCDPLFIEWIYVLDPIYQKMAIFYHKGEHEKENCKLENHYNCNYVYRHHLASVIDLMGEEPDWKVVECGEDLERCHHYKWYHDPTICKKCDGDKNKYCSECKGTGKAAA